MHVLYCEIKIVQMFEKRRKEAPETSAGSTADSRHIEMKSINNVLSHWFLEHFLKNNVC